MKEYLPSDEECNEIMRKFTGNVNVTTEECLRVDILNLRKDFIDFKRITDAIETNLSLKVCALERIIERIEEKLNHNKYSEIGNRNDYS
jgi:hypothetical protein